MSAVAHTEVTKANRQAKAKIIWKSHKMDDSGQQQAKIKESQRSESRFPELPQYKTQNT
jgi:hypothetical protein